MQEHLLNEFSLGNLDLLAFLSSTKAMCILFFFFIRKHPPHEQEFLCSFLPAYKSEWSFTRLQAAEVKRA